VQFVLEKLVSSIKANVLPHNQTGQTNLSDPSGEIFSNINLAVQDSSENEIFEF